MKAFIVGLGLLGIGTYVYYRQQVKLLMAMKYSLNNIVVLEKNKDKIVLQITLNVKNDSEIDFTLSGWQFNVLINGEEISRITDTNKNITINAYGGVSQIAFNVAFNPSKFGLLDLLASVISTGKSTLISINGNISIFSGFLSTKKSPINITKKLKDFI